MRQPSIPFPFARATLAALFAAAVALAQSPEIGASRIDAGTGELVPRWSAPELDASSWAAISSRSAAARPALPTARQDDDYSVRGLFTDLHGEFMQKGFQFRENIRAFYGYQSPTEVSGGGDELKFQEIRGDAFVPITLDPDMLLILGASAGVRRYEFSPGAPSPGEEQLWRTAIHAGIGRFFTEDLYVEAVFRPGVFTDYGGTLTRDDWKFYGDVVATYRLQENFYGKLGLVYDGTFTDVPVYPVIGFGVLFTENFRFDLLLPKSMELSWIPDPSWIFKVGLLVQGEEYHARTSPDVNGNKQPYDVTTQEVRLFFDGTFRFDDNLSVFGRAGSTLFGDTEWGNPGGATRMDGTLDPTLFVEVGAGLSF